MGTYVLQFEPAEPNRPNRPNRTSSKWKYFIAFAICLVILIILMSLLGTIWRSASAFPQPFNATTMKTEQHTDPKDLFELPIIHLNDFHARFEETSLQSTTCKPNMKNCIGGFSRLYTAITQIKEDKPDALVLNAGDNFQGTMWYNIYKWNVTQHFLNMLPTDVYTLGNHEFDDGVAGAVPFIKALKAPVVVANMDASEEPTIDGLYKNSTIIHRGGKKIGVIGVILSTTNEIANTEKLKFLDESEVVREEAKKLKLVDNCDIIIVLSHCGLDVDKIIAKNGGPYINLIVGGHSHSFLYSGNVLPGPDIPVDDYPVTITQDDGHQVLIVQASCYTKYLGYITVYFDGSNKIHHWTGNPIYLNQSIPQDERINEKLLPWKEEVDKIGQTVLGETRVVLSMDTCLHSDSNFGNFITDAMVYSWAEKAGPGEWTYAPIALINCGGIRTGINKGNITYADLLVAQPFENFMDAIELRGDHLLEILEYSVSKMWSPTSLDFRNMLQVSGIHVTFNRTRPSGSRIQDIRVRCGKCEIPRYEPLNEDQYYRVTVNNYLISGGDGFSMIAKYMRSHKHGERDIDILTRYIKQQSPILKEEDERINVVS